MVVLTTVTTLEDPAYFLETDWTAFDNAADRVGLFDGESAYRLWNEQTERLPYLYPPYALWLAMPLRVFGFYGSWAFSAFLAGVTSFLGLRALAKARAGRSDAKAGLVVAMTSGLVTGSIKIGQYSGIYVMAFGLATWLWVNERKAAAGLALSLLVIKPNLAIAVPIVLVWSRSWSALRGFALGVFAALLLALPFGLGAWSGFVRNVSDMGQRQLDGQLLEDLLVSVPAAFQVFSGASSDALSTVLVWLAVAAIGGVVTLLAWRPDRLASDPVVAFGVLAMYVVVANPRVYFYDGALAVFGALALWLSRDSFDSSWFGQALGPLCFGLWLVSWGSLFVVLNPFFAVVACAILFLAGYALNPKSRPAGSERRESAMV